MTLTIPGSMVNFSVPPSAAATCRHAWMETNGYRWLPQHVLLYCQQVIVPELQERVVGMSIDARIDAYLDGIHAENINYLRAVDVRLTADELQWKETGSQWSGTPPVDWYMKRLADELRFTTTWFGNNVRLYVRVGPMTAPYCVLKSM